MKKITEKDIKNNIGNLPFSFEIFDVIDSTNSYARRIVDNSCDKRVIISDMQTNGRGRVGREFYSPSDNGIYMSVILKLDKSFDDLTLFTVAIASITLKAIEKVAKKTCEIKWVNDIFLDNKKVCGILCENILSKDTKNVEYIVVGIGINVKSTENFPENILPVAGALCEVDRNVLISEILKGIFEMSQDYELRKYLPFYKEKSLVLHKNITFENNGVTYEGKVVDINDSGNLEVELLDGSIKTIKSGEIRLSLDNIY